MPDTDLGTLNEAIDADLAKVIARITQQQGAIAAAHIELDYWRIPSTDPDTGRPLTLAGRIALGMAQGGAYRTVPR